MKHTMKEFVLKFGLMGLLAVAVAGVPQILRGQTNPAIPPGFIKIARDVFPFRGKLKTIDNEAKTITLNNDTIQITSETIITRQGKPAMLADGAPGDRVSGTYRKNA